MEASKEIQVSIMLGSDTIPVGKLWYHTRKGRQSASFEYYNTWLTNPNRFALDPALTLSMGTFHTGEKQSLFGAFGDSAPDRWGRILMQRANQTTNALSELDYLLGVNDETRQGALRFSVIDGEYLAQSKKNSIPPMVKLPDLLSASEKFLDDKATADELRLLLIPGSSLGGARPKASVIDKDGSLAIAKFPRKDDDTDIVLWEAAALTLAKTAGINTPEWRLETILKKPVLIIKRFDRIGKERIPFLSAMSMLGAADNDSKIHSYVDIANALQQCGVQPDKDKNELWRRMVFGIMITNTDDHLRNHGFLFASGFNTPPLWGVSSKLFEDMPGIKPAQNPFLTERRYPAALRRGSSLPMNISAGVSGWALSPAYDLNPNTERKMFATSVDTTGAQNTIELAMQNIDAFGLSDSQAKVILDEVKSAVSGWRTAAKHLGISQKNVERMKAAFLAD